MAGEADRGAVSLHEVLLLHEKCLVMLGNTSPRSSQRPDNYRPCWTRRTWPRVWLVCRGAPLSNLRAAQSRVKICG